MHAKLRMYTLYIYTYLKAYTQSINIYSNLYKLN